MRRRSEAGYALLLVYAMAASIAIMLYLQLPKVAFEKQRDKEQLLIDRGEQYSRAVQLYVRKYNRFPADIQALENTQSIRFLRRRYRDPMTGKEEWREIHVGPGGVFTDSKIYGPKKNGDKAGPQTFITEMQQIGGNTSNGPAGVNLALRQRPSQQPGAPGDPNNPSQGQSDPNAPPGTQPGAQVGNYSGPVMVLPDGRVVPATPTGQPLPAPSQPGTTPGQTPGSFPPGTPAPPGVGVQNGVNGVPLSAGGLPPGFQTQANNPNVPGAPPAAAANLINQILTSPRPGGLNGIPQPGAGGFNNATPGATLGNAAPNNTGTPVAAAGGQVIGGGFAGVASKDEREGIKIYREKTEYDEWEFVYDMTKDITRTGGLPGNAQRTGPAGTQNPLQNPIQIPSR